MYFTIQSRMIGHHFSRQLTVSGGSYVATGRGLSIYHKQFKEIYVNFAAPVFYVAVEQYLLLIGLALLGTAGDSARVACLTYGGCSRDWRLGRT